MENIFLLTNNEEELITYLEGMMKSTKFCFIAGAVFMLSANAAKADMYSNPLSENPFSLSLDTGASAWQNASALLHSASTINTGTYTSTSTSQPYPVSVDPLPGVAGSYDIFQDTTTTTISYTSYNQSLNINYSAGLAAPILVPEIYALSGQINARSGATLYAGGHGYLNFNMGMNVSFVDPYLPGTASGLLTFKIGNAPGNWTYQYQTPFSTGNGVVSLSNGQFLDLNTPTFFEADYSIAGNSGVQFGINNLNLNVNSDLSDPTTFATLGSVTSTTSLYHLDIPALPTSVPLPAAAYLLGSGLTCLIGAARWKTQAWA